MFSRFFSEGNFSVERKKLQSPSAPLDPTTCPSCGPYRYRPSALTSDASSHSTGGYISGISPSPSELALPNVAFSTLQLDQVDSLAFEVQYMCMYTYSVEL